MDCRDANIKLLCMKDVIDKHGRREARSTSRSISSYRNSASSSATDTEVSPRGDADTDAGAGLDTEGLYFKSYSRTEIHRQMIRDEVRTGAYKNAILHNEHLFKGKVVLDVGCGTGILSLFAAKAGAKRVIGVEMADLAVAAGKVVEDNNLSHVVTIIRGKVEEVELPGDVAGVDVIVSEWMGYGLFFESMVDSVLFARDKWLVEDGVILPDIVRLFVCGVKDDGFHADRMRYLSSNDHELDLSELRKLALCDPCVATVSESRVITNGVLIKEFNLMTGSVEETSDFHSTFTLDVKKNSTLAGLVSYFDVVFSLCHRVVEFSTSPSHPPTHWQQLSFFLRDQFSVAEGDKVRGLLRVRRNRHNFRDMDVKIQMDHTSQLGDRMSQVNSYTMKY